VAVPLCSFGFFLLAMIHIKREEPPIPMKVLVQVEPPAAAEEPPPPDPITQPEQQPEPDTIATRPDAQEESDQIDNPVVGEEVGSAEVMDDAPAVPNFTEWLPNTLDAAELASITREVDQVARALAERQLQVRESIVRQQVISAARDFELSTDGATSGAIRLLDLEGYPFDRILPILQRYGFKYERRHVKPSAGRSYLNAAVTSEGVFTNTPAEGVYDVLSHSPKSIAIMASREVDALMRAGYEPARSRVRKIVFGIVKREDGSLDFDVTHLEAEQIR
jgi:hypothetical protein